MQGKILSLTVLVLMVIGSFGATSLESKDNVKSNEYVSGEVIVGFTDEIDVDELQLKDNDPVLGCKIIQIIKSINVVVVKVEQGKEDLFISRYQKSSLVKYAELNEIVQALDYPNDPAWSKQWGPKNILCPEGWPGAGSENTVIAIIDTGVDIDHEDLASRLTTNGYDFVNNDDNPDDDYGHGTHCAGIAAAITNNGKGIAGVVGESPVKIMGVKVLGSSGSGSYGNVAAGIDYAAQNGADIISMSLGGSSSQTIKNACKSASDAGVVLVAAAGNDGVTSKFYPAGYDDYVIAVAAISSNNDRAHFSNYGDWVDIAAPGVDIYSTYKGNEYISADGTSMACPHVAGVAALGKTRGWSRDRIWQELESCADEVNGDFVNWGKVDATYDGNNDPPDDFKIEVTLHKITQKDDIDFDPPAGDGAEPELYYEITTVSSGKDQARANFDYSSSEKGSMGDVGIKYYENNWKHRKTWNMGSSGLTHGFNIYGGDTTMDITIKLMDSDWIWHDLADISSRNPDQEIDGDDGRIFRVTYNLITDELTGDKSVATDSGYFPRYTDGGKWDGTDGGEPIWDLKQDDAYLEFSISDTYNPKADGGDSYSGVKGRSIKFTGKASGGQSPYDYYWKFGDGSTSEEQNPTHTYISIGTFTASLKITDDFGNSHTDNNIKVTIKENSAPNKPDKPSGPTSGERGVSYKYKFRTTDPEGDLVSYYIDWGDGDSTGWTDFVPSATSITKSHSWEKRDKYNIRVKAKDIDGKESAWSTLEVSMPKNKEKTFNLPLLKLLENYPLIYQLLQRFLKV